MVTIADNDNWYVQIVATDAEAAESSGGEGNGGEFTVTRYGETDTQYALDVFYAVSGTAVEGTDYDDLPTWGTYHRVTIPADETSVTLDVDVIDDTIDEDSEWVIVTVLPDVPAGYHYFVGTSETATVSIAGDPQPNNPTHDLPGSGGGSVGIGGGEDDGSLAVTYPEMCLSYLSATASPRPMIAVDAYLQLENNTYDLSGVEVSFVLGGVESDPIYYSTTDTEENPATETDLYRFTAQVDASTLSTGAYGWTMTVTQNYDDQSTVVQTFTGTKEIVNRSAGEVGDGTFGAGWRRSGSTPSCRNPTTWP